MRKILIALALAAMAQGTAAAQDKNAVVATVRQFVDAFNKGDTKAAVAACTDQASIIDEFPPYEWRGTGGCARWANDYDADAKKNGVTGGMVILGSFRHVDVTGDRAYVVGPATYACQQRGKPVKETGSMLTVVLQKGAGGWRIAAWAWTRN